MFRKSPAVAICFGLGICLDLGLWPGTAIGQVTPGQVAPPAVPTPSQSATVARAPKPSKPPQPATAPKTVAKRPKPAIVAVPIPTSNPAIGSGVTAVAAILYQPRGAGGVWTTGVGAIYTSTKSYGFGILQKAAFAEDRFRLTAGAGYGDFNLRFYGSGAPAQDKQIHQYQSVRGLRPARGSDAGGPAHLYRSPL